ncbi:hypothetical protein DPMN_089018 [Dreissena polymorpha]|uniref:Laminin EGF-like domain-containing protein n=1 Tax=Dreissena polymorpha TaxID=45954 RepID=A0A9D4KXD7_DREPO|nr:hypothetical protein DPMN_089018 [Dreissena polymorpha]
MPPTQMVVNRATATHLVQPTSTCSCKMRVTSLPPEPRPGESVTRCAPGLVMGPCIVEIDRIVIMWPMWAGRPRIDRIVIRICRNEEIVVKGNFVWVWPILAGRPRAGNWAMHKVQYQLEVNRCKNEEVVVKSNFGWVWPILTVLSCIVEIDRIVIREFQYQFEENRCRNEEIIVKGNFGWVWSMWAGAPGLVMGPCIVEIDCIVIREVQYQFEVNRCRNEEVNFQGSSAYIVEGDSGQDGQTDRRTDRRTAEITTISPRFSKSTHVQGLKCDECRDEKYGFGSLPDLGLLCVYGGDLKSAPMANVQGTSCNQCKGNTWGLSLENFQGSWEHAYHGEPGMQSEHGADWTAVLTPGGGCLNCDCHATGSLPLTNCNTQTGQCECRGGDSGVTGIQCDMCLRGYYGFNERSGR